MLINEHKMKFKKLGNSDLNVSAVCLGMMTYGSLDWRPWCIHNQSECDEHVKLALDLGINFYDTANIYSSGVSEIMTGKALKKFAKREHVYIATKVGLPVPKSPNDRGLSKVQIMKHVTQSLKNLDTDYIDLYQIHRWDYDTDIHETMVTLHELVKKGMVRHIGASSMHAHQLCEAQLIAEHNGWTKFISMQNHYNIIYREEERDMNVYCEKENISLIPWSPVARGLVCGTRTRDGGTTLRSKNDDYGAKLYGREADFEVADIVMNIAQEKNISGAELALAWLHSKKNMASPIFGASKLNHIREAANSTSIELSEEDIQRMEAPYKPNIQKPWNI